MGQVTVIEISSVVHSLSQFYCQQLLIYIIYMNMNIWSQCIDMAFYLMLCKRDISMQFVWDVWNKT